MKSAGIWRIARIRRMCDNLKALRPNWSDSISVWSSEIRIECLMSQFSNLYEGWENSSVFIQLKFLIVQTEYSYFSIFIRFSKKIMCSLPPTSSSLGSAG